MMAFFLDPLGWLLIALTVATAIAFVRRRGAVEAGALLLASGLLLLSCSPLPRLLLAPLEERFPNQLAASERVAGIVVFGGISATRGRPALQAGGARPVEGMALALAHPGSRLVFSGGHAPGTPATDPSEAEAARILLSALGFPTERLTLEDRSRTTWENAVLTSRLLGTADGGCWVLVTSAFHMPRAMAALRAVGREFVAYPVDYRTRGDDLDFVWFAQPAVSGLGLLRLALHEWGGLVWYRLSGRTTELFPAPRDGQTGCPGVQRDGTPTPAR